MDKREEILLGIHEINNQEKGWIVNSILREMILTSNFKKETKEIIWKEIEIAGLAGDEEFYEEHEKDIRCEKFYKNN